MKTSLLSLLALLCLTLAALGEGSFNLEEMRPFLKDSAEWQAIEKQYDVEPTGVAVRFGNQWE